MDIEKELENILARICALEGKKKKEQTKVEKSTGSLVWEQYAVEYKNRYKVDPVRNAMVNKQCSMLVSRVGVDDAILLVRFYLRQNDGWYTQKMHPVGLCLNDAETLMTRMRAGVRVTPKAAKEMDDHDTNAEAAKQHLARKYGR